MTALERARRDSLITENLDLVRRVTKRACRIGLPAYMDRSDVEDVLQLSLVQYADGYVRFFGAAAHAGNFRVFVTEALRCDAVDEKRKFRRRNGMTESTTKIRRVAAPDDIFTDDETPLDWRMSALVEIAVQGLSLREQQAVYLTYWDDMPQAQAADMMGISTNAFECLLRRAKNKIRMSDGFREFGANIQVEGDDRAA